VAAKVPVGVWGDGERVRVGVSVSSVGVGEPVSAGRLVTVERRVVVGVGPEAGGARDSAMKPAQ